MRLTWPSQRSRLWMSKANMLGTPACARTSSFGIRSCQVMPKILLRQRRWKVLSLRSWREWRVPVSLPCSRVLSTQAAVHVHLGADGQHGVVQDPLSEMFQCCSALQFVCSVQCLGRGCWRWWNLGKWSPPPPRECSRRWRCLGCCWRLGQGCWSFCDWCWDQNRYKRVQRW